MTARRGFCHVVQQILVLQCDHGVGGSLHANRQRSVQERSGAPSSAWAETQQIRRKWPFAQIQGVKAVASAGLSGLVRAGFEVSRAGFRGRPWPQEQWEPQRNTGFYGLGFFPTCSLRRLQFHFFGFHFGVPQPCPRPSPLLDIFFSCRSQPASWL